MKTFARITSIVLIISGILILFGGLALGVTGAIRSVMTSVIAARPLPLRTGGANGLILLVFVFVEGLTVTALGEGLFVLVEIAHKMPTTSQ